MVFQVEEVYPIENGIIAKLRYDRDKLVFDASQIKKEGPQMSRLQGNQPKEWTYVSITDHPLDDIHPLSLLTSN